MHVRLSNGKLKLYLSMKMFLERNSKDLHLQSTRIEYIKNHNPWLPRPKVTPMASTKKDLCLCIHCKENVRPTDMLQCFGCKSWVHYECTELPTYALASLENSQRRFSCKHCVEIPDTFLEKMNQSSSSKNSSGNSSKVS